MTGFQTDSAFSQENRVLEESIARLRARQQEQARFAHTQMTRKLAVYTEALQGIRDVLDISYGDVQLEAAIPSMVSEIIREAGIE